MPADASRLPATLPSAPAPGCSNALPLALDPEHAPNARATARLRLIGVCFIGRPPIFRWTRLALAHPDMLVNRRGATARFGPVPPYWSFSEVSAPYTLPTATHVAASRPHVRHGRRSPDHAPSGLRRRMGHTLGTYRA